MGYNKHDWKGYLINDLISDLNFKSYLELGVSTGESWKIINCEKKVGVDSDINVSKSLNGVIHSDTDNYFLNSTDSFDLIYIDALHEKHQVYRDFKNSFHILNESGIIIFHDINPLELSHTNFNNCGDVFEFWIELSKNYKVYSFVGPNDDTVGIFLKSENIKFNNLYIKDYTYEFFSLNREKFVSHIEYNEIINKFKI